jgi:hypothetical protein
MLDWVGTGCNCTDLLSCNGHGSCLTEYDPASGLGEGQCLCEGNYDGKNCLKCKPNWYGSRCQFYCDSEADYDDDDTKLGCHGRGTCTVINLDTVFENVVCECDTREVRKRINGRMQNFFSSFSPDINCKDCFSGYFPKLDIFNSYDTTLDGLYVPCQVPCVPATCNELGTCNDKFGAPDETLCLCDKGETGLKHISEESFCTTCDANWFPDRVREPNGCTNFCVADLKTIGSFPEICDDGDIDCVHCNGVGSCNADGACECEEGYTGDFCQIQCTSPNGVICGGHGTCSSNELQTLLQFELEYIEDSGPLFQCTCDPQDPYTKEAREQYIAEGGQGQLDPPPEPTYFGETCDFHCLKPPWENSDECNGLGNCTIFEIRDPLDNTFECSSDDDCTSTDITRILSGDNNWHDKKGPFCRKHEYPNGCESDNYHLDNCIDILSLQRPEAARKEKCVESALCRHTMETFDWHNWCTNMEAVAKPPTFENCGEITQFCPVQTIDSKCSDYVSLSTGTDISAHMDYCYENDKKRYPFNKTREYRLNDESAVLHDRIIDQMMEYHEEHPSVDIDIQPYCIDHMKKFDTVISKVDQNKRFACGSLILSEDTCLFGTDELTDTWTPFTVYCPNESPTKYHTLEQAENNRGFDCYIKEDESRRTVPNAGNVPYGGVCFGDSDCANGFCNGNTCCSSSIEHCATCNTLGQCTTCKDGTSWDGIQCTGTPTYTSLTGIEQKEGLDMIDTTCSAIETKFPKCSEPQNACDLNPCKDGDTCTPSDKDGICETKGILDCTCKFGLTCVPVSFSKYKCIGEFVESTCPQEYTNFNWAGYCQTNNPVLKQETFGSNLLEQNDPPSSITLSGTEQSTEYIHYWVQPTTIFSSSKYIELTSDTHVIARIYMHQGQIQLNEIAALESCPNTNPTCQEDWSYQPNKWYHLELSIDYLNRKVSLVNLEKPLLSLQKDFECIVDGCHSIQTITEMTFNGNTATYFDQIVFEKDIANPSLYSACDDYPYCDVDVNYRNKCSDIIRNVQYPLLLEPSHDIIDTCKNFFEYQSFDSYSLTFVQEDDIQRLDWDTYCLFYDSIPENQYNCDSQSYQYFENYNNCRNLLDPLDGSKTCMSNAMIYDWSQYCFDLDLAAVPSVVKNNCPKSCYKRFKNYQRCDERLALFEDNINLKNSTCSDKWVPFCKDVAMNKHKGICSGVECQCNREKYEGVSGTSCELQCPIAADGTACGEEMGVGKCVYTDEDQKKVDNGFINDEGNLIAFDGSHFEILGECDCYLTEGKRNCDQECFRCNETAYKEVEASGVYITTTEYKVLDMQEDDIISGIVTTFTEPFNVSVSMDNVYYEPIDIVNSNGNNHQLRAFGRFVKVVPPFDFQLIITRAGQVGMCNGATGVCQCLPPYTAMIEEKYTNWRGQHRKRLKRVHNLPQEYDAEEEFRIRAMQGKEVFVKQFIKKQDNSLAYSESEFPRWKVLYHDLRDNPEKYKCMPDRSCNKHDLILLGNLDESSYRFNFDCNTQCQGTNPNTLIPCSGHGSCRVTGDCVCDPAAYIKGTNEVTGFSMEFNLINGDTVEDSEYEVSKFDRTGWRGTDCGKMCPGYDPVTKSMLNVCGGRGICNDDAECECELGYTGEYCQFTCPGFDEGEENVCSGHGTCELNLIEIILQPEVVLYDGYCGGPDNSVHLNGYSDYATDVESIETCVNLCQQQNASMTATIRTSDGACSCSKTECADENQLRKGEYKTYTLVGASGAVDPINCDGVWSEWSVCDGERQYRTFRVKTIDEDGVDGTPRYGGTECPVTPEYRACYLPNTDCDGTWSTWSSCDGSYETRTFTVNTQPVNNGLLCPLSPQKRVCLIPSVDCDGSWGSWSTCTNGKQQRSFTITQQPTNLGLACPESPQIIDCTGNEQHCIYSANEWSECDKGIQTRTYSVTTQAANGGMTCPSDDSRQCYTCTADDKCESGVCLGDHCCSKDHYLCGSCNVGGECLTCASNAAFAIDGTCHCNSGYHEYNGTCVLSARRRLRATRCAYDMELIDGACVPVNCNKKYNATNMLFRSGMGCVRTLKSSNLLPSCSSDADCPTDTTNGQCKGGVCCHKDYDDTTNCQTCNDGVSVWRYEVRDGYLTGGLEAETNCMDDKTNCMEIKDQIGCSIADNRISGCRKTCAGETGFPTCENNLNFIQPYGYEYAVSECDRLADCKGIYHVSNKNEWYLRDETNVTVVAGYETYKKIYEPNDFCSLCISGATYIKDRQRCKGLSCPVGQEFVDGVGCQTIKGEADKSMQIPVQLALSTAWCSPGFYRDKVSNECQPIQMHPMIDVTLFIDEGREDEVSMTFGCEVWGPNLVKCPQCACNFDAIYGKWSSFECETCLKGYGQKQCRKQCPGYDGENDISMCNGFGTCAMGSVFNKTSELRSFQDATCTCGNPPGSVNEAGTEMNVYNSFYTELTTVSELSNVVACHNSDILEAELVDTCYHFDMSFADCSTCEFGFSGKNCRYQCEKCLVGGRCDSTPSNKESSLCECPADMKAGLWSYNCCPIGFMVVDIDGFNAIPQETPDTSFSIDDIGLNSLYLPDVHDDSTTTGFNKAKRNADYWCKPCPGVDISLWLSPQAQYQVCGGVNRGECYRDTISTPNQMACKCFVGNGGVFVEDSSGTMVAVTTEDYGGEACRCRPQDNIPFINLQQDYGCFGQGACLNKVVYLEIDDVKNPGTKVSIPVACSPDAGYYTRLRQSVDPVSGEIVREIEIVEAHIGTHVPFNNFLYLTDESGSPNNYVDLDTGGNIASGVVKAYDVSGIAFAGVEVIGLRCNNGYYQNERGQTTCKQCSAGKFTPGVANHVENSNYGGVNLVVPQWETFEAYKQCYSCPPGRITSSGGMNQCTNCHSGYYQNEQGKSACKACPAGQVQGGTDKTESGVDRPTGYLGCNACSAGKYSNAGPGALGATACLNCPKGRYQDTSGQSTCKSCPGGKYQESVGQSSCDSCLPGSYLTHSTSTGITVDTSRDFWGDCVSCPPGKRGIANAYAKSTESTACENCPAGQYQNAYARSTSCKNCDAGLWSNSGRTVACTTQCDMGYYCAGDGNKEPCPKGKYGDSTGLSECKNCAAGYYTDATTQVQCKICAAGKGTADVGNDASSDCTTCTTYYTGSNAENNEPNPGCPSCGTQTWKIHKNALVGTDIHGGYCGYDKEWSNSRYCGSCGFSTCKFDCHGDPCGCYKWRTYPDHSSCPGLECLHTCSWQGSSNSCGWRL